MNRWEASSALQVIGVLYLFQVTVTIYECAQWCVLKGSLLVQSAEEITQIVTEAQKGDNNEDDILQDEYVDDYMDQSANIDDWRPKTDL